MLQILDKVEEKYFASDATVAPGGWYCWCWCCNSASVWGVFNCLCIRLLFERIDA